jgi:hypothetical protein
MMRRLSRRTGVLLLGSLGAAALLGVWARKTYAEWSYLGLNVLKEAQVEGGQVPVDDPKGVITATFIVHGPLDGVLDSAKRDWGETVWNENLANGTTFYVAKRGEATVSLTKADQRTTRIFITRPRQYFPGTDYSVDGIEKRIVASYR